MNPIVFFLDVAAIAFFIGCCIAVLVFIVGGIVGVVALLTYPFRR